MRKAVYWIILIFTVFIFTAVGGELILRIYDKAKGVTAPYTHNLPECIAVPNGYFNYDLQPNLKIIYDSQNPRTFSINRWGFRAPNYNPIKPKGTTRIFCFGGSSTFDPYVSDEQSWSFLIGEKLSKKFNHKVESINAGRFGYTTSEIIGLFYHRVLRHQPDIIIIYSTYNDALRKASPYFGSGDSPQLYGNPVLSFLNKNSALFAFLDFKIRYVWQWNFYSHLIPIHSYAMEAPPEHFQFISDEKQSIDYLVLTFERNIRTIVHMAKDNNVKVILSTQLFATGGKTTHIISLLNDVLYKIATQENVSLINDQQFGIKNLYKEGILQTYVHLTPKGSEFLSDKITSKIINDSLIKSH
jgi:lysophospholipase L1-like esterase